MTSDCACTYAFVCAIHAGEVPQPAASEATAVLRDVADLTIVASKFEEDGRYHGETQWVYRPTCRLCGEVSDQIIGRAPTAESLVAEDIEWDDFTHEGYCPYPRLKAALEAARTVPATAVEAADHIAAEYWRGQSFATGDCATYLATLLRDARQQERARWVERLNWLREEVQASHSYGRQQMLARLRRFVEKGSAE